MEPVTRRTAMMGALGAAGAVTLAACSGGQSQSTQPAGTAAGVASSTPTASVDSTPRWPLTGKVLTNADDAKHIVVAVKVPDNHNEHPQKGLNDADIVYVELDGYPAAVGKSSTRLVPVFHSKYAADVAPVRSIRPVDIPMLSPMTAIIGNTGAAGWVLRYVKQFDQYIVGMKSYMATKGTGAYSIDPARVRVYKGQTFYDRAAVCHPKFLAKLTTKFQDGPQQNYFPWAASDAEVSTASGKTASSLSVPWKTGSDPYKMSYTWNESKGQWLRSMPWGPHVLADGKRVVCDNVLVIRAEQAFGKIQTDGSLSKAGHQEPIHKIINSAGTFFYAQGGKYVTGKWTKGAVNEVFAFTLDDGSPLKMAPGRTFVELPNLNANVQIKG